MTCRSSVLYTLSSVEMIARLGGVPLGAWLLKNGAASVMLLGVTIMSTIIPILSFLPYSTGRSPKLEESQEPPTAGSSNCPSDISPRANSPRQSNQSNVKDDPRPEQPLNCSQQGLMASKWSRRTVSRLIRNFSYIPFNNPVYPIFLAIMFVNGLAMDVREQLRSWTSKRYDLPLATVGYILSVESFLSIGILFALPWLDRVRQLSSPTILTASGAEVQPFSGEEEAIVLARNIHAKRYREILVARVSLGLGAAGAVVLALAATRGMYVVGLGIMTGAVGFPDAIREFFTSRFETDDI